MKIPFERFRTQLPDGWIDESTVIYTMPELTTGSLLPTKSKIESGPPASIAITWEKAVGTSPHSYLENRLNDLRSRLPGFSVRRQGDADVGGSIPFAEFSFPGPSPFVQILLVRRLNGLFICVTGTARPSHFETVRETFVEAAREIQGLELKDPRS